MADEQRTTLILREKNEFFAEKIIFRGEKIIFRGLFTLHRPFSAEQEA